MAPHGESDASAKVYSQDVNGPALPAEVAATSRMPHTLRWALCSGILAVRAAAWFLMSPQIISAAPHAMCRQTKEQLKAYQDMKAEAERR